MRSGIDMFIVIVLKENIYNINKETPPVAAGSLH